MATLDEIVLVIRRNSGLRFDPELGFHLYGADIASSGEQGLDVVALAAPCHHNSRSIGLPEGFLASAEVFARKWSHRLPVATPCVIIDKGGAVCLLGNAVESHGLDCSRGAVCSSCASASFAQSYDGPVGR